MNKPTNPKLIEIAKVVCRRLRRNETNAEKLLWPYLRNRNFFGLKFYRQHPIFVEVAERETFYVADFFCHERRTVIELDGGIHQYRREQDQERERIIEAYDVQVIRIPNEDIEQRITETLEMLASRMMPLNAERGEISALASEYKLIE